MKIKYSMYTYLSGIKPLFFKHAWISQASWLQGSLLLGILDGPCGKSYLIKWKRAKAILVSNYIKLHHTFRATNYTLQIGNKFLKQNTTPVRMSKTTPPLLTLHFWGYRRRYSRIYCVCILRYNSNLQESIL